MRKTVKAYFKYRLFSALINPFFYFSAVIFNLLCAVYFFFMKGFFSSVSGTDLYNLFFITPFFSIFLISALVHNIKKSSLEQCIPLGSFEKIFIEWLSVAVEFFLIILPLVFIPCCVNLFGTVDWGIFFSAYALLYFFAFAAISLCIFFSVVFENSTLSLISGILILALFSVLNLFLQQISSTSFLTELIKTFSLSWHFSSALMGIFDTRDYLFFIIFTLFFISASSIISELKCGKVFSKREHLNILCLVFAVLFLHIDSNKFYYRKDISQNGRLAISKYTQSLVSDADEKIFITYYRSRILESIYPEERCVSEFFMELARNKKVVFKKINADKAEVQKNLEDYGIYGRQFRTNKNNSTEFTTVYSCVVIEYCGKYEILPFVLSSSSLEFETDLKLLSLIYDRKSNINILCGNGLNLSTDYSYVLPWLEREGFECKEIKSGKLDELSYDVPLLLLGSANLSENDISVIRAFLEQGGKLLALTSPYEADFENTWFIKKSKNQDFITLLSEYGFHFSDSLLADISCSRIVMQSDTDEQGNENPLSKYFNYPLWPVMLPQKNISQEITLFWPSELLIPENSDIYALCFSSPSSWGIEPDYNSSETLFVTNPFIVNETNYEQPKEAKPVILSSGKITLIPDQYFIHSLMLGYISDAGQSFSNLDFVSSSIFKLKGENELSELLEKSYSLANRGFYKTYDKELFDSAKTRTLICEFIFVPVLILIFCVVFFMHRKGIIFKVRK